MVNFKNVVDCEKLLDSNDKSNLDLINALSSQEQALVFNQEYAGRKKEGLVMGYAHKGTTPIKSYPKKIKESKYRDLYPENEFRSEEIAVPMQKINGELVACSASNATYIKIMRVSGVSSDELCTVPLQNIHQKTVEITKSGHTYTKKYYLCYYKDYDGMKCLFRQDIKNYKDGEFINKDFVLDRFHFCDGKKHFIQFAKRKLAIISTEFTALVK